MNNTSSSWIKLNLRRWNLQRGKKRNRGKIEGCCAQERGLNGGQGRFIFILKNQHRQANVTSIFQSLNMTLPISLGMDWKGLFAVRSAVQSHGWGWSVHRPWCRCDKMQVPALVSTPCPTSFSEVRSSQWFKSYALEAELLPCLSCTSLHGKAWLLLAPVVFICKMQIISAPTSMGCREGPVRQPRSSPMVSPGLGTPEEHNIYLWAIIFHSLVSLHMLFPLLGMTFYLPDHQSSPLSSLNS